VHQMTLQRTGMLFAIETLILLSNETLQSECHVLSQLTTYKVQLRGYKLLGRHHKVNE